MKLFVIGRKESLYRVYDEETGSILDVTLEKLSHSKVQDVLQNVKVEDKQLKLKVPGVSGKIATIGQTVAEKKEFTEDYIKTSKEIYTVVARNKENLYKCVDIEGREFWVEKEILDSMENKLNNYSSNEKLLKKVTVLNNSSLSGKEVIKKPEDLPEELVKEIEEAAKIVIEEQDNRPIIEPVAIEEQKPSEYYIDMDTFYDLEEEGRIEFIEKKLVEISQKEILLYQLIHMSIGDIMTISKDWVPDLHIKVKCIVDRNLESTHYVALALMQPEKGEGCTRNMWVLLQVRGESKVQRIQALSSYGYNLEDDSVAERYKKDYLTNKRINKYLEI